MSGPPPGGAATLPQPNTSTPEVSLQPVQENSQGVTGKEIVPVKPQVSEEQINEFTGQPPTLEHMVSTKVEEVSNNDKSIPVEEVTGEIVDSSSPQNASKTFQQTESQESQDKKPVFSAEDITNAESFITKEFAPNTEEEAAQFNLMYQRVLQDAQGSLTPQEAYKKAMAMHYLALAHGAIQNSPHLFNIQPYALAQILYKADLGTYQLQQQNSKFNAPPASSVRVEEPVLEQSDASGPYPPDLPQEQQQMTDQQVQQEVEQALQQITQELEGIDTENMTPEERAKFDQTVRELATQVADLQKAHPQEIVQVLRISAALIMERAISQEQGQTTAREHELQQQYTQAFNHLELKARNPQELATIKKWRGYMGNEKIQKAIRAELTRRRAKGFRDIIVAVLMAMGLQVVGDVGQMTGVPTQ